MADYDVAFAYSTTNESAPNGICSLVAYQSVLGVPDELLGQDRLDYIEAEIRRSSNIGCIKDIQILRPR